MTKRALDDNITSLCGIYEIKEIDRAISYFVVKPFFVVCDVGGRYGVDALALAKRANFVINLDIDTRVLKIGKKLAKESGVSSRLDFIKASAMDLPFKNEALDLITCFSVLDHLPNKIRVREAISEFSRVIRRSGYVAITVPNKLFLLGTLSMKIKSLTQTDAFQEQRFTPSELWRLLTLSRLRPIIFRSKYPVKIGPKIIENNLPRAIKSVPGYRRILFLAEKVFGRLQGFDETKLFGARMGYLSQKINLKLSNNFKKSH